MIGHIDWKSFFLGLAAYYIWQRVSVMFVAKAS